MHVCLFVCGCVPFSGGALKGQDRVSAPLELELQVSCELLDVDELTLVLLLLTTPESHQPQRHYF